MLWGGSWCFVSVLPCPPDVIEHGSSTEFSKRSHSQTRELIFSSSVAIQVIDPPSAVDDLFHLGGPLFGTVSRPNDLMTFAQLIL